MNQFEKHRVYIQATDIELPLTPPSDQVPDERLYTFYVWAQPGPTENLDDLLRRGQLQIDVVGAGTNVIRQVLQYTGPSPSVPTSITSREVVALTINSKDITGAFEIVAWFPDEARMYYETNHGRSAIQSNTNHIADLKKAGNNKRLINELQKLALDLKQPNPWLTKRTVNVYKGDLRTELVLESQDTVERLLGPQFAKYFYAGRVFFRNRRSDFKMVIYTTSMKANVLFYREPDKQMQKALTGPDAPEMIQRILEMRSENLPVPDEYDRLNHELTNSPPTTSIQTILTNAGMQLNRSASNYVSGKKNLLAQYRTNLLNNFSAIVPTDTLRDPSKTVPALKEILKKNQSWAQTIQEIGATIKDDAPDNPQAQSIQVEKITRDLNAIMAGTSSLQSSPIDQVFTIPVGPNKKPLVYSPDTLMEATLSAHGYMWREQYRPMTFQVILDSLITSTENSPRAQVMRWLEAGGMVAGATVGLGGIFKEVTQRGYIEGVAMTTSVLLPTARKLLLDDLEKYIRNLGDNAMDTVVVVPPNGVVDKYVFFPRGPILFGVNEFNINNPAFIVEVSKTDVSVDATLIEKGQEIDSGILSAESRTAEAINRGKAVRAEEDRASEALRDKLRQASLVSLEADVARLVTNTNTNAAVNLIRSFQVNFGPSPTADRIISKYNLPTPGSSAPEIAPLDVTVNENGNTNITLTIQDDSKTLPFLKLSAQSSNRSLIDSNNFSFTYSAEKGWVMNAAPKENQFGTNTVTVTLRKEDLTTKVAFPFAVKPTYRPPRLEPASEYKTFSSWTNQLKIPITRHAAFTNITASIASADTPSGSWIAAAVQGTNLVLSVTNGVISEPHEKINFTVTLKDDRQTTTTNISISFLTNHPPQIRGLSKITTRENQKRLVNLTVVDPDDSQPIQIVEAISNNQKLIPDSNIARLNDKMALELTPNPNEFGDANIRFKITDGEADVVTNFTFSVSPEYRLPKITIPESIRIPFGSVTNVTLFTYHRNFPVVINGVIITNSAKIEAVFITNTTELLLKVRALTNQTSTNMVSFNWGDPKNRDSSEKIPIVVNAVYAEPVFSFPAKLVLTNGVPVTTNLVTFHPEFPVSVGLPGSQTAPLKTTFRSEQARVVMEIQSTATNSVTNALHFECKDAVKTNGFDVVVESKANQ